MRIGGMTGSAGETLEERIERQGVQDVFLLDPGAAGVSVVAVEA